MSASIAILGAGKLGTAIAKGLVSSNAYPASSIALTTKDPIPDSPFEIGTDNVAVVKKHSVLIISVLPQQIDGLLSEIKEHITPEHEIISTVTGVSVSDLRKELGNSASIIRAMPNTAISVRQSMTCICGDSHTRPETLDLAESLFNQLGQCIRLREEQMDAATALCACGTAFFMRAIRAASQGGIEIGFHSEQALFMAAQTALGAASLLVDKGYHPESEIDHVTSPQGCTIAGLNQMEHAGFSSAMIKGITTSAEKARKLYQPE